MRFKLKRSSQLFFQNFWSKLSIIMILCFLWFSFISNVQRKFVALQFAWPMTQNLLNFDKELRKYWKMFDDRYMFMMSNFTLASQKLISLQTVNVPHASINNDKKVLCHRHHCYSQLDHIERIGHKDLHTKPVFKKMWKIF